jgi:signal transduction histidine kinase/AraC-like DNA-binding protein/ABC-type sugar transport system substrate-binding protein
MSHKSGSRRIGAFISPSDPFWVQVREVVYDQIVRLGDQLISFDLASSPETIFSLDPGSLIDDLFAQELDAFVCIDLPPNIVEQILSQQLPVIYLSESPIHHALFTAPTGLYVTAQLVANFMIERLQGRGRIVYISGMLDPGYENGKIRISGFLDTWKDFPEAQLFHIPSYWRYEQAYPIVYSALRKIGPPIDGIFGCSDSLALAARDAGLAAGLIDQHTIITGVNGDPLALAAIAAGNLAATVETPPEELGGIAAQLAHRAALGESLPDRYPYFSKPCLITSENLAEAALRKVIVTANIPSHLVGINISQERKRLVQLETSAAIHRRVGAQLDRRKLFQDIADLIRANYDFDVVRIYIYQPDVMQLSLVGKGAPAGRNQIQVKDARLFNEVIQRDEAIFIPDTHHSLRFPLDPDWPSTRSRTVLPIHLGDQILGILDLHSQHPNIDLRWDVIGLQLLADQLGIALRNTELYAEALQARAAAERANQLKSRLLANVSHELRTPLNVILGYSQTALQTPNPYDMELPPELRRDLGFIYQSGEHLIRLINDLLDLSRAEIGALELFPEAVDIQPFLVSVFNSLSQAFQIEPNIQWCLDLPERLPVIQADPVRLRQILLNLLSNAAKFTNAGQICLGARVEAPYLHLWVADTGAGIPVELQERIFEPFGDVSRSQRRREGIGLGLSITRHLVTLHGGTISLESQPDRGSTFHVYLPLPNLADQPKFPNTEADTTALLVITGHPISDSDLTDLGDRLGMRAYPLQPTADLEQTLDLVRPAALAWDLGNATPREWNLVERLRSHAHFSRLPFILFNQVDNRERRDYEITDILVKPFSAKSLVDLIDNQVPVDQTGLVLVVDDDPQACALYGRLAAEALPGCFIQTAENGARALEIADEIIPCLIILDLVMPEMDGFGVLAQLRANPQTAHIPVVVMSGKILTFEDVRRLNFSRVSLHTKDLHTPEETIHLIEQSFAGSKALCPPTSSVVKTTLAFLHQNYSQNLARSQLAEVVGVSENYLSQIFRQEMGLSPWECLNRLRIHHAKQLLTSTDDTITSIALRVGFNDPAYFSRVFRKLTGKSPLAYRQNPL